MTIGYSYDFNVRLSTSAGGSHEISLIYEFVAKPIAGQGRKKLSSPDPIERDSSTNFCGSR